MSRPAATVGYKAAFTLVERILELMERRKVSRAELARRVGVKRAAASKWFSPGRNLTVFTAAMIAEALGAEIQFRFVDKEKKASEFDTREQVNALPVVEHSGNGFCSPQTSDWKEIPPSNSITVMDNSAQTVVASACSWKLTPRGHFEGATVEAIPNDEGYILAQNLESGMSVHV
jgi:transcriptional regulator with XRE-family HTH domain